MAALRYETLRKFDPRKLPLSEIYAKISGNNIGDVYAICELKQADYAKLYRAPLAITVSSAGTALAAFFLSWADWISGLASLVAVYGAARLVFLRRLNPKLSAYNGELRVFLEKALAHKQDRNDFEAFQADLPQL
jgi:hypothetical protein